MTPDNRDDAIARAWRHQSTEGYTMDIEGVPGRARQIDARFRRQDLAGIAAFALIVAGNVVAMVNEDTMLERVGDGLTILAAVYVLFCYWRSREAPPAALGAQVSIAHCRQEIVRRQSMLTTFWPQLAVLFLPGIVLSIAGGSIAASPTPLQAAVVIVAFITLVIGVEWVNRREARKLQASLESLEGYGSSD